MDNVKKSIKKLNKDINILLCYLFFFPFSYLIFKLASSLLSVPFTVICNFPGYLYFTVYFNLN